jgi:hypothetical protein
VRWLSAIPNSIWVLVGLGLVLAVSAIFGGLNDAEVAEETRPVVPAGEAIETEQFTLVVESARLSDVAPDYSFEPEDGNVYLIVEAVVTNKWTETNTTFADVLQLDWIDEPVTSRTARTLDGSTAAQANPHLPIGVTWVWEVPEDDVEPGATVRVTALAKSFMADGDVTYGSYWFDPVPVAYVDLEVSG